MTRGHTWASPASLKIRRCVARVSAAASRLVTASSFRLSVAPAGNGHFGANHIDRLLPATRLLRGGTKDCSPAGNNFAFKRTAIIRASHAGIEVDLLKPRARIGFYGALRFAHRLHRRLPLPWIRPQMISAENQPGLVESFAGGNIDDQPAEFPGQHAGVASKVIHLVGGGLDQEVRLIFERLINGCFENPWVRGADGVNAFRPSLAARLGQLLQCV